MSKAFTRETDTEDEEPDTPDPLPAGIKNYMTPTGYAALQDELRQLLREERPRIVEAVAWAAGNGDRSENGDYIYNKKRLREIDRRARYLTKRLESAEVVDPQRQRDLEQVFFGATVSYAGDDGVLHTVTLVGIDEADLAHGKINWQSPVAKALLKSRPGDRVRLQSPAGATTVEIVAVRYTE
jgi:transcription elongation factor GreB